MNAKRFLLKRLKAINYSEKPGPWMWLNALMMAVSEHADIRGHQESIIEKVCGEVSCKWRTADRNTLPDDVFIIATWINTANPCVLPPAAPAGREQRVVGGP